MQFTQFLLFSILSAKPVMCSVTMSAFWTESLIKSEGNLIEIAERFVKDIGGDEGIVIKEFRSFLTECNKTRIAWQPVTQHNLFDQSHHPYHVYVILGRLLRAWPHHLTRLKNNMTSSKCSGNFQSLLGDFIWTNESFEHRSVTRNELKSLKNAIRNSFSLYGLRHTMQNEPLEVMHKKDADELLCSKSESILQPWHHCIFEIKFVPYIRCKVEILSINPNVRLYHDMYSESERIDILKEAGVLLKESAIYSRGTHIGTKNTDFRTSASAWLSPKRYKSVDNLYRRVAFLSGLEVDVYHKFSPAERLQVVNYGIGGRFVAHYDYWDEQKLGKRVDAPFLQGSGERLATWMFYLTEPEIGGATVFTELGLKVKPKLGSALVWDNLRLDGSYETLSKHAGCPVAIGQKWIGNIWIRSNPQMFRRRCPAGFR